MAGFYSRLRGFGGTAQRRGRKSKGGLRQGSRPSLARRRLRLETLENRSLLSAAGFQDEPLGAALPLAAPAAEIADVSRVEQATAATASTGAIQAQPRWLSDALLAPAPWAPVEPASSPLADSGAFQGPTAGQTPYGADRYDGSEFMLGDVWVTVVLLESDGSLDSQTENWSSSRITTVKNEIQEGLDWWEATLAARFPASPHTLEFHADFTYADAPVATPYEPITRPQSDQGLWINSFLNQVGYNSPSSYFDDLSRWNDDRRKTNNAHWAFTVFVADSLADGDGMFSGGYFAYAYLGGPFMVMTYDNDGWGISRMGHVTAHETGHIFYALDEYPGSNIYTDRAGYYNTQNLNASDGHPNPGSRVPSMMAESNLQMTAYTNHTSSPSSLGMLGWQDSDSDGIFDVLDVPLTLTGSGAYNAATGRYEFAGTSSVGVLPNQNPYGSGHGITINTVDRLQYRLNGGSWMDGAAYGGDVVNVAQDVAASPGTNTVEFRTIVAASGVSSPVWSDTFDVPNQAPVVSNPIADVAVDEDAADTVLDLAAVFDDPDLPSGDVLTYTVTITASASDVVAEISQPSYTHIHQDLLYTHAGDNRGFGAEHDAARDNIQAYFERLGLTTELVPFTYSGGTYYNVVATKPGAVRPDDIYLVGAHYDSVNNPGADDNGSGTAAVLEIARVLSQFTFDATLRFVAFDREEQGLYGSTAYAAAALARGDQIQRMVNLDMVGYNPGGLNQVRLYDGDNHDEALMPELLSVFNVAGYGGPVTAIDGGTTNRSDHYPFDARGYDAALIIESAWGSNPYYHQPTDAVETGHIDYAFATHVTSAVAGYVAGAAGVQSGTSLVTATVNGSQLVLDWVDNAHGTSNVTVRATDRAGLWVEDTFAVAVNALNDAPGVAQPLDDLSVAMNSSDTVLSLQDVFTDPDLVPSGDHLTYSVAANTNPGLVSATIDGTDLRLAYQENESGLAEITVRATDAAGLFVEDTFHVAVADVVALVQIMDDGDVGFTAEGSWQYATGSPFAEYFQSDTHFRLGSAGSNVARWAFTGLSAGEYRISVTWVPHSNRATDAQYTIGDGTEEWTKVTVNQESSPDDFADAGASWEDLGASSYAVTGTTIVVELSGDANEYLIADAVRVERVGDLAQTPEIQVWEGPAAIVDGVDTVNFGNAASGTPVTKSFTVKNVGTQDLILVEPITVPGGFSVTSSFAATTVLGGQSTTFTVTLDAASAGTFGGEIAFGNNDADENPFNFTVTGTVAEPAVVQIVDDGDPGFSTEGSWQYATGSPFADYFQSDTHFRFGSAGSNVARWAFTGLSAGEYRISATWVPDSNRATDAQYTVGDGTAEWTKVTVNQESSPDDFADAGASWEDLGASSYAVTGTTIVVELSGDANEYLIADAVRIERVGDLVPGPEIQVWDGFAGIVDGVDTVNFGNAASGTPVTKSFTVKNVGTQDLILVEPIAVPDGFSVTASFAGATVAPGQSTTFTIALDAASVGTFGGEIAFGNSDADENPFNFTVTGTVAEPAVVQIVDDGDPGFSTEGSWEYATGPSFAEYFQSDTHYRLGSAGNNVARWTFTGLSAGEYRVSATWTPYANRATNAQYTVGDGSAVWATATIDQESNPDDFAVAGASWEDLGASSYAVTGTTIVVELSGDANQYLIADAVRIERLSDLIGQTGETIVDAPDDGFAPSTADAVDLSADESQRLRVKNDASAKCSEDVAAAQFAGHRLSLTASPSEDAVRSAAVTNDFFSKIDLLDGLLADVWR